MIKNFLTYSLGAIILRLVMASSVILTIKFITPDQFGMLALLNNLGIFLPIILGLGLRQVLAIEFFGNKPTWILIWELNLIYLMFAIPAGLLLVFNLNYLNQILFCSKASPCVILLVILTSLLNFWPELLFQLLRFQNKSGLLASIQIAMGLLLASTTSYLLYFSKLGITSVLLAQLITQFTASLYFAYLLFKNYQDFNFPNIPLIKNYLKIGLPFIPNIILAWLILACNRWLLNWKLHNLTLVGIYSLSENISLIFQTIITQPLMHSFLPHAFSNFAKNPSNLNKIDSQYQYYANIGILFLICLIPISFYLCKRILCFFLPDKYLQAIPLLSPLLIAQVILAGTYISSASLQYLKKTHLLIICMLISALLAILINLWLIPIYQVYSCPIATCCAYSFYFGSIWLLKRKLLK